ncbi:hypothetical protein VKT23_011141 [Stygiomarasmius scandens]|uniref:Uncharacterized protein n=1 Tax=Marasmiellus scandens TaxID=2682957 RepID=A0ABR1JDD2_9AGAR
MSCPAGPFLFLRVFALVFLSNIWLPVQALHNISIDNSDPIINYSGEWPFDNFYTSGATDHWSPSAEASATIEFTGDFLVLNAFILALKVLIGVAVYYRVHLYPSDLPAGGLLSVDNYAATGVVMWDPDSEDYARNSTDVWCMTGLPNGTHTLNVKFWDNGNNDYITLDTILVTQLEAGDFPTSSPVSSSQTASSTSSVTSSPDSASDSNGSSSSGSSNKALPIALGTVFGLLFLGAAIAAGFFFYRFRQYRAAPRTSGVEGNHLLPDGTASTNTQYDPYNPDGGMQQHQDAYAPIIVSMAQYSSPVPSGTESSTKSSYLPSPNTGGTQGPTMSRLISDSTTVTYPMNVRMSSAMNSSQTSLHGSSLRMAPGGAQLSSRLPEV